MSSLSLVKFFQSSSSFFAVIGGVLLPSKTHTSGYGFVFLGSSNWGASSNQPKNQVKAEITAVRSFVKYKFELKI